MRGVVLPGDRRVEILDFPDPTPGPGEVVLEIKASGLCGSDLKFYRATGGAASLGFTAADGPVIAGHEPCGVGSWRWAPASSRSRRGSGCGSCSTICQGGSAKGRQPWRSAPTSGD